MFKTFINAFKIKDIRKKILMTLLLIVIYRLGCFIPIPGVNVALLSEAVQSYDILGFLDLLTGSSFSQFTLFAMGISPYITASIILQLLTIAIPSLERLSKEEDGREKIERITRYTGIGLALVQSIGIFVGLQNSAKPGTSYLASTLPDWMALAVIGICATAGTAILMWLGERITEKGIGNGISMLIFASIVSRVPQTVIGWVQQLFTGVMKVWAFAILLVLIVAMITLVVHVDQAQRRIPVQYAKRVVGRKMYGGQSTHLPMKVNMSGVLPIIFAQSIASLPPTIILLCGGSQDSWFMRTFDSNTIPYAIVYFLLILFFAYFYATIQFNPVEVANNLKKNGGFIPGYRPGKPTSEFIQKVLNKVTLFGAIYLGIIACVPIVISACSEAAANTGISLGGTSIIIVVGVAIETVQALESQMLMRHYKGFLE